MSSKVRRRGYVLLFVLLVLTVLTVAVAALYSSTRNTLDATQAMTRQKLASTRADLGAQVAISYLKRGSTAAGSVIDPVANFQNVCTGPVDSVLHPGNCAATDILVGSAEGGVGNNYAAGDGWRYRYWVYRRKPLLPDGGESSEVAARNLLTVYAEGYFGRGDAGSVSFGVAAVEADVMMGMGGAGAGSGVRYEY